MQETSDPGALAHRAAVEAERADRNARLRDPLGWLTLVGLHWLHPGMQSFGAGPDNEIVLGSETRGVPAVAGVLEVIDGRVILHPAAAAGAPPMAIGCEPVADGTELVDDLEGSPTMVELGPLRFHLIRRGAGRLALRVRDTEVPALRAFDGVPCFHVDPAWRLRGRLVPAAPGATIPVPDVVGDVNLEPTPGVVELSIDGRPHRLEALEGEPGHLWLIFGDVTNGAETYAGGRFLSTGPVQPDGTIEVDFNLAYNPPCVFSPYATCPMVPAGNTLPVRIEAGERVPSTTG